MSGGIMPVPRHPSNWLQRHEWAQQTSCDAEELPIWAQPNCVCMCVFSHVWPFATPWIVAHQAPLSMEFPRQEYRYGLQFPTPGDILNPGVKSVSPASLALAGRFFTTGPPGKLLQPNYQCSSLTEWKSNCSKALALYLSFSDYYSWSLNSANLNYTVHFFADFFFQ